MMIGFKIIAGILVSGGWLMAADAPPSSSFDSMDKTPLTEQPKKLLKKERRELRRSEISRNQSLPPSSEISRELTVFEMNRIIDELTKPLSRDNNLSDDQKRNIYNSMIDLLAEEKMKAQKSATDHYCPKTAESRDDPLMQKILKNPSRSTVPGIYAFSNILERFNGILRPKNKEAARKIVSLGYGKILDGTGKGDTENERRLNIPERAGTIFFDETFNVSGIPVQEVLRLIKFFHPKAPNGVPYDKLPSNKFIQGLTCSFAEKNFACGNRFDIFLKHLQSCSLDRMSRCISDAKESAKIKEMLSDYWDYFWKDSEQRPAEQEGMERIGRKNSRLTENKRLVEPNQRKASLSITRERYPNKESFLKDDTVRENAVGLIILDHLVSLETSNKLMAYKNDHQAIKEKMIKMVQDLATDLAKIKIELDRAKVNGMISNALTGGISKEAGTILDKSVDAEEKRLKEEEEAREKAYRAVPLSVEELLQKRAQVMEQITKYDPKEALVKQTEQTKKIDSDANVETSRKAYKERKATQKADENRKVFAELPGHVD